MSEHNPVNPVIFALDVDNQSLAHDYAHKLKDDVGLFKVGLELFCTAGPQLLEPKAPDNIWPSWSPLFRDKSVFLDLKLHDIPETVRRAAKAVSHISAVRFISVHASGGSKMLKAACEAAPGKILAVTVLTSMDCDDLQEVAIHSGPVDVHDLHLQVLKLATLAESCGCIGIICAPTDVKLIRQNLKPETLIITPGVRPAGLGTDDQKRVATPEQAMLDGADYIVVGRPIRDAQDPAHAARVIANEAVLARARRKKG